MSHDFLFRVRNYIGLLLLLAISCNCGVAAEDAADTNQSAEPKSVKVDLDSTESQKIGPKIVFEETVRDFGNVSPGEKKQAEFKFKNTGDELLIISKVSKTCGCTPHSLAKKEYAPGESGILEVGYNASKKPGKTSKKLFVSSNDKSNPKVQITIKADIIQKVRVSPKKLNLSLKADNAGALDIKITSVDEKPFSIKKITSTEDTIKIDFDPNERATELVLKPKVDTEKLKNKLSGRVTIYLTHPETKQVIIPYAALSEFKAEPPIITLFNRQQSEPVNRTIYILSNYNQPFEIESVVSKNELIEVISKEKLGNRYKLELEITPPEKDENVKIFKDDLTINIKGGDVVKVKCLGTYRK